MKRNILALTCFITLHILQAPPQQEQPIAEVPVFFKKEALHLKKHIKTIPSSLRDLSTTDLLGKAVLVSLFTLQCACIAVASVDSHREHLDSPFAFYLVLSAGAFGLISGTFLMYKSAMPHRIADSIDYNLLALTLTHHNNADQLIAAVSKLFPHSNIPRLTAFQELNKLYSQLTYIQTTLQRTMLRDKKYNGTKLNEKIDFTIQCIMNAMRIVKTDPRLTTTMTSSQANAMPIHAHITM